MSHLMNADARRAQFLNDAVLSASPAKLLTMLYDRLVLDLDRGEKAQLAGDIPEANKQLTHAQDILTELIVTLDVKAWDGAPGLMSLYNFLVSELIEANITKDAARTAACRAAVEPLRAAWHEAAAQLAAAAQPAAPAPGAQVPVSSGFLGVG